MQKFYLTYSGGDYILFYLAIILFFGGLALLGAIIEWQEKREAKKRQHQLRCLNHCEELRRRHNAYMAQMNEALDSLNRGHSL